MRNDALFRKFTAFASACAAAMLKASVTPAQKKPEKTLNVVACAVFSEADILDSAEEDSLAEDFSSSYPRLFERIIARLRKIKFTLILAANSLVKITDKFEFSFSAMDNAASSHPLSVKKYHIDVGRNFIPSPIRIFKQAPEF